MSICHQTCYSGRRRPGVIAVCAFNHVTAAYALAGHKQDACWRLSRCKQTDVEARSIVRLLSFPGISISNRQLPGWVHCSGPDILSKCVWNWDQINSMLDPPSETSFLFPTKNRSYSVCTLFVWFVFGFLEIVVTGRTVCSLISRKTAKGVFGSLLSEIKFK